MAAGGESVLVLQLDDAITPASDDLVEAAIQEAEVQGSEALLLLINTPGGGLQETLNIIEALGETELPVIGYVYPEGSTAWSAGTLILMSTDIAAMAPHTIVGSAQPVRLTPMGTEPVNDTKTNNALVALIEEKARMHGRNVTAAKEFVVSNLNLNAEQALSYQVIELIDASPEALLERINGREIKNSTLETSGAELLYFQIPLRLSLIQILSDPMLSSLLLLVGLYGLIFGISNPGLGAEVFGVVALAMGLIGSGFNVNLGAIFLLVLGMGLLLAELHSHSFGVLAAAGLISIVAGSILFVPVGYPEWYFSGEYQRSALAYFLLPSLVAGGFFALALYKVAKLRLSPPFAFPEWGDAEALESLNLQGHVLFRGEYWLAEADEPVAAGETVEVLGRHGSILRVRPK
jgi:membrane-bound serine protease (ClpP class)